MSLVELVITLAIVAILAAMGTISYQHFILKAQTVEGQSVLVEINRLEALYLLQYGRYTDDLTLLGFSGGATLRYHRIEVQSQNNGARFVASAIPLASNTTSLQSLSVVMDSMGSATQSPDPSSFSNGQSAAASRSCKEGGDATVLSDGALDMNFCDAPTYRPTRR